MSILPFVSIVVPVFNDEKTIELCLNTLLRQSYPLKEIIVVNDGSTDKTPIILSRLAEENQLLRIIQNKHSGITITRNIGIINAKGDIVFFGEGDAIYKQDYLAKAVEFLVKNPNMGGVCLTGAPWVRKWNLVTHGIDAENRIQRKMLEEGKLKVFYAWVYRKSVLKSVDMFDSRIFQAEDKDLFLRLTKRGYPIGLINGIYWRHIRDQDLPKFIKRNYNGGKTRVLFLIKHRKATDFLRTVGFLWYVLVATVFGLLFPILYTSVLLAVCSLLIYKLIVVLKFGWSVVRRKRDLFFLPLFTLIRHISTAIGTTHGIILFSLGKLRKKTINWNSIS